MFIGYCIECGTIEIPFALIRCPYCGRPLGKEKREYSITAKAAYRQGRAKGIKIGMKRKEIGI